MAPSTTRKEPPSEREVSQVTRVTEGAYDSFILAHAFSFHRKRSPSLPEGGFRAIRESPLQPCALPHIFYTITTLCIASHFSYEDCRPLPISLRYAARCNNFQFSIFNFQFFYTFSRVFGCFSGLLLFFTIVL